MDPFSTLNFFIGASLLLIAIYYLDRINKNLALIRSLVAAFMEQRVASTVADNKLAAAVEAASKETREREVA